MNKKYITIKKILLKYITGEKMPILNVKVSEKTKS
jgi:hypothetical protein